MADGDAQFSAAILSRLQKQQDAFGALASALELALAEGVATLNRPGIENALGAIESGIADVVAKLGRDPDTKALDAITAAIAALKLDVTVNVPEAKAPVVNLQVQPTPITVEAVMPPAPAPVLHFLPAPPAQPVLGTWEVRIPGNGYNAADKVMTITRLT